MIDFGKAFAWGFGLMAGIVVFSLILEAGSAIYRSYPPQQLAAAPAPPQVAAAAQPVAAQSSDCTNPQHLGGARWRAWGVVYSMSPREGASDLICRRPDGSAHWRRG